MMVHVRIAAFFIGANVPLYIKMPFRLKKSFYEHIDFLAMEIVEFLS